MSATIVATHFFLLINPARICDKCAKPMHIFFVHASGGGLGGEEYDGYSTGDLCKPWSRIADA